MRKMGDDLGDEWWTHEGDSGTFIACHFIDFGVTKTAVAGCQLYAFLRIEMSGKVPVCLLYASYMLTFAS